MDTQQLKYQDDISDQAVSILKSHHLVYLAMGMRTGKTITAFLTCKKMKYKKVLMVSKKIALDSLNDDAKLFSKDFKFYCTNYENIHSIEFKPDVVIIDEAHSFGQFPKPSIRTAGSKEDKKNNIPAKNGMKQICEGLPIIYLSGTPTPESYSQIYHQLYLSSFSPFKEYTSFYKWANDYVNVKKKYLGQITVNDYSGAKEREIRKKIDHLFISFTQKEAGFNQEVKEEVRVVKMDDSTSYLIELITEDRMVEGNDGSVVLAETEVKLMNKIHQISSGTVIAEYDSSDLSKQYRHAKVFDYSKSRYIYDQWKDGEYKGKKIAIYYKFVAEWAAILATFGHEVLTDDPKEFNKQDHLVFVKQIQSGREGVNLSSADYIIMYNIDFSAVSYFQVRDRMQTKNRTKPSIVHWIFSDCGIEKKIYERVSNKKDYTLSYFRKDYEVDSVSVTFVDGKGTRVTAYGSTKSEAAFKARMLQLMERGCIDDVIKEMEQKNNNNLLLK